MTVTHLDPHGVGTLPTRGIVVGRTRIIHAVLDKIHERLAASDTAAVVSTADIEELERIARRLEAVKLALLATADRQQGHRRAGHTSTAAWVASATGTGGASAQRDVTLAVALNDGLDRTREAFAAGQVSSRHAGIIASTMAKLPESITTAERARVEDTLVRDAQHLDPPRLHRSALTALAAAQRTAEEVAQHVEQQLLDEERRAYAAASVTMVHRGDGTTRLAAIIPTPAAKTLEKVLQSMTSPRRDHLRTTTTTTAGPADGQTGRSQPADGSVAASLFSTPTQPTADVEGVADTRPNPGRNADWASLDWAQRKGRALTDLLEHLDTERLTGKIASTIIVTMTLEGSAQGLVDTDSAPGNHDPRAGVLRPWARSA